MKLRMKRLSSQGRLEVRVLVRGGKKSGKSINSEILLAQNIPANEWRIDIIEDEHEEDEFDATAHEEKAESEVEEPREPLDAIYSLEEMRGVVEMWDQVKGSGSTAQQRVIRKYGRYGVLPHDPNAFRTTISRMRKVIAKGGTVPHKQQLVRDAVLRHYREWRVRLIPVHDRDLSAYAVREARRLGLENFKASSKWVHYFKAENAIVSRKIDKYRTAKWLIEKPTIEKTARDFVTAMQVKLRELDGDMVSSAPNSIVE